MWFVLLAVALLGALTAIIARSGDTAEQSGATERHRIQATSILRYSAGLREAVGRMQLDGAGENAVSFENAITATDYANAGCGGLDCLVFGSAGGGQSYAAPDPDWLDSAHAAHAAHADYGEWIFTGANAVPGVRSARPDLAMVLGYLKKNLCTEIDSLLDLPAIPADADGLDATAWQGTFSTGGALDGANGKGAACIEDTTAGGRGYVFYQVLIRR